MLKVGLTGSIAVGKSYVCDLFRGLGCHVLDADQTARDVVQPNTEALRLIAGEFGNHVLTPDGHLDRKALASVVFADDAKRNLLNSIVHPLVMAAQDRWLDEMRSQDPDGIAIVDAALMIESGGYKRFEKLIVVWCEPAIQLTRLMKRDGFSEAEAVARISAQMPQEEKKRFADYLIDTSGTPENTGRQVVQIFVQLQQSPHE